MLSRRMCNALTGGRRSHTSGYAYIVSSESPSCRLTVLKITDRETQNEQKISDSYMPLSYSCSNVKNRRPGLSTDLAKCSFCHSMSEHEYLLQNCCAQRATLALSVCKGWFWTVPVTPTRLRIFNDSSAWILPGTI